MKYLSLLIGLAGLGAAGFLIFREGPALIFQTFAVAGWGAVLVSLLHLPHVVLAGIGWQALWPPRRRPPLILLSWLLWVREAVNALLPVAKLGGEVAALGIMRRRGMPLSAAVGSLVVETTVSVLTSFAFVLLGVLLLARAVPGYGAIMEWAAGLAVALLVIAALIGFQRLGAFRLASRVINFLGGGRRRHLVAGGVKLDRAVRAFYGRPARLAACAVWSYLAWFVGALEIWVALHFLNHPAPFATAVILEAMLHATISMAFFVPAALGVQEATLLFFGQMLGLPPNVCLALALVRRCRDVFFMAPGLLFWQIREGGLALKKIRKSAG